MINNKKVGLILPTRYDSQRLPGKVLMEINCKKQIERIIERALQSKYIDEIILAISDHYFENDLIFDWFDDYISKKKLGFDKLSEFTGSHANIALRTYEAAETHNIDIIVDISHDCTFFDPGLADFLIDKLFFYGVDYSANCIVRSYPDGFDIQVYTKEIYQKIINETMYIKNYTGWNIWHNREKLFPKPKFYNDMAGVGFYFPEWHLSLDTEKDKILIERICNHFENKNSSSYFHWYEIINFLKINLELLEINKNAIPTELLRELL
jgi:spore coat polysaccharide biosynthesis protein SpsF (cytidylyltransferase family)